MFGQLMGLFSLVYLLTETMPVRKQLSESDYSTSDYSRTLATTLECSANATARQSLIWKSA